MKCYITSVGERTEGLCLWSVKRCGFEPVLIRDKNTTLAQKLQQIYEDADEDFLRVDADVILNKQLTPNIDVPNNCWWLQFACIDWIQQTISYGGTQFIKKEALPYLRASIPKFMKADRPETGVSRIPEFFHPRRFKTSETIVGLHGYKYSQEDLERVIETKRNRNYFNNYDFEWVREVEKL